MSKDSITRIEGSHTYQEARRRSRYGHREWIVYTEKDTSIAERASAASLDRAMRATGKNAPKNAAILFIEGTGMFASWNMMENIRNNLLSETEIAQRATYEQE
jgi:hypothetical protein